MILLFAVIRLASPFTDGIVLQRECCVPVWGVAEANARVEVAFADQSKTVHADSCGHWRVDLDALRASSVPRKLIARCNAETHEIKDILVGEVWICAGQSNMELPLCGTAHVSPHSEQSMDMGYVEAMTLNDPMVRTCLVPKVWACQPQDISEPLVWKRFAPGNQRDFSAIGCHFAMILRSAIGVPVGIVSVAWGGARIEGFIPPEGFLSTKRFKNMAEVEVRPQNDPKQRYPREPYQQPRAIWNGRVHPLVPMAFRGVLWYQGESNVGAGLSYEELLTGLRSGWMSAFERKQMPIYVVQIAPYYYPWIERLGADFCDIWDGMNNFVRTTPDTALVTTVDIGESRNIHPAHKRTVALRLAANALHRLYGRKDIACDSPSLKSAVSDAQGNVTLLFDHVTRWLMHDTPAAPFELAGGDEKFHRAQVSYGENGKVFLFVEGIKTPVRVRYMWRWTERATLANEYGFPLAPFRALVNSHSP